MVNVVERGSQLAILSSASRPFTRIAKIGDGPPERGEQIARAASVVRSPIQLASQVLQALAIEGPALYERFGDAFERRVQMPADRIEAVSELRGHNLHIAIETRREAFGFHFRHLPELLTQLPERRSSPTSAWIHSCHPSTQTECA